MTYQEIKDIQEQEINTLIETSKGFFAFSNEQLEKGMKKINVKDKKDLASLPNGLIVPKENATNCIDGFVSIGMANANRLKNATPKVKREAILYELNNHECYYTGDTHDVVEMFEGVYTSEDINKTFKNKNYLLNK